MFSNRSVQRTLCCGCAAAAVLAGGIIGSAAPAAAQGIDVIIVTAQKREQTLSDVPIAVSAFSGDALEQAQVDNLNDLQFISPNLIVAQGPQGSEVSFTIRGIGSPSNDRGFEQSVGVYIDGVFRGRQGSALQDLVDIERVEVLRGPQSTIFGRNNSAGALSIVTKQPEFEFGGTFDATYGSEDLFRVRGSVTGPIIEDRVAFRLTASHNERGGFVENLVGDDLGEYDRQTIRGQLFLISPTPRCSA